MDSGLAWTFVQLQSQQNDVNIMSIWHFDIVPDDGFINWCVTNITITIYHLSVGILNFINFLESGSLWCSPSTSLSLAKSYLVLEASHPDEMHKNIPNIPKPRSYRMLLKSNPWPSMTIPWCEWRKMLRAQSATKLKRRTVQPAKNKLSLHIPKTQGIDILWLWLVHTFVPCPFIPAPVS